MLRFLKYASTWTILLFQDFTVDRDTDQEEKKRMAKTKRLEWCIVYFINSLVESKKTQEGDEAGDGAGDEAGVALEAFFTIKPA